MVNDDPTCMIELWYCDCAWYPREAACDNGHAHEVEHEGFHRAGREEPKSLGDSAIDVDGILSRFAYGCLAETSVELNRPPCSLVPIDVSTEYHESDLEVAEF